PSGLVATDDPVPRRSLPSRRVSPSPFPGSPRLLLMMVRSLNALALSARTSVSGFPTRPNPPTINVAPSKTTSLTASSAESNRIMRGAYPAAGKGALAARYGPKRVQDARDRDASGQEKGA